MECPDKIETEVAKDLRSTSPTDGMHIGWTCAFTSGLRPLQAVAHSFRPIALRIHTVLKAHLVAHPPNHRRRTAVERMTIALSEPMSVSKMGAREWTIPDQLIDNELPEPYEHPTPLGVAYTLPGPNDWYHPTSQTLPGFAHLVPPAEQVLDSKEILTMVLHILKDSLGIYWKKQFASLILVNRTFFWAGTAILWREMKGIMPALKLLPWCNGPEYRGLGVSAHPFYTA